MADSATPTIAEAIAALREFAARLTGRADIYLNAEFGEPAPAELLAPYRANPHLLPPDLLDFYELMNGCVLNWEHRVTDKSSPDYGDGEEDSGGRLMLAPLGTDDSFNEGFWEVALKTDNENGYTFFGAGAVSVFFDQIQPEYGTWLVAYGPAGPDAPRDEYYEPYDVELDEEEAAHAQANLHDYRLIYLFAKVEEAPLPGTIAQYIIQGLAYGFVHDWPLAHQGLGHGNDYRAAPARERLLRYQALTVD